MPSHHSDLAHIMRRMDFGRFEFIFGQETSRRTLVNKKLIKAFHFSSLSFFPIPLLEFPRPLIVANHSKLGTAQ